MASDKLASCERLLERGWRLAWCPHGQFKTPEAIDALTFQPARVPGSVVEDLLRLGLLRDPFRDTQFRETYWLETQDFWYRTTFEGFPTEPNPTGVHNPLDVSLCFDGIDTFAEIFLNGVLLGETRNMFRRFAFPIGHVLSSGSNHLAIRISSPVLAAKKLAAEWEIKLGDFPAAFETHERLLARKMQMSYGWDNHPRIVNAGVYRAVRLITGSTPRLRDFYIQTERIDADAGSALLCLRGSIEGCPSDLSLRCMAHCGDSEFEIVAPLVPGASGDFALELTVENPLLWWPLGFGAQNLYDVTVSLLTESGVADQSRCRVGIRTVRVRTEPVTCAVTRYSVGRPSEDVPALDGGDLGPWSHVPLANPREVEVHPLVFEVNGMAMPMVGANWQPCDAIYSRASTQKGIAFLDEAVCLGFNMIRVWGGGFIEPDEFYSHCSEVGLLVWQDFPFASANYPQCDEFLSEIESEARDIINRLRGHTCLAGWCGDNESDMNNHDRGLDPRQNRINYGVLPAMVAALDPGRYYHPSSPWGVEHPRSPWSGDNRNWGAWHPQDNFLHVRLEEARFISEGGAYALPARETVDQGVSPENQWPIDSLIWDLHGGSTDTYRRDFLQMSLRMWRHFADFDSVDSAIEVSQFAQAWGAMALVLHCRRRWPETGGVLWWKLNDCWPCMDGGIIDYRGHRRMCFYSLRYGASPQILTFFQNPETDLVELHLINLTDSDCCIRVRFEVADVETKHSELHEEISANVPPMTTAKLGERPVGDLEATKAVFRAMPADADSQNVQPGIWTLSPACAWRCYRETDWIHNLWRLKIPSALQALQP